MRRMMFRTVFSFAKKSLYILRQRASEFQLEDAAQLLAEIKPNMHAPITRKHCRSVFTPAELCALSETSAKIRDNGVVEEADDFLIKSRVAIKFSLKMFVKAYSLNATPDFSDNRFGLLQGSLDVRNRITHPKAKSALEISDAELSDVREGFEWFKATTKCLVTVYTNLLRNIQAESS